MVDSLETRRQKLEDKLAAKKLDDEKEAADKSEERQGYGLAIKLSSEFIAAIFVGALLGYLLDTYAGTAPWGMIVFLLLGFAAGVLNVLRSIGAVEKPKVGYSKKED
ncbi:AtpZ/AtpI family protein [Lentilitoribacter sp. Alg239-R112]|uniref:AtpZ/AtpI family protein n=1 Tax=Lentilitoribacter sp. Alg239-R112 TaxID=2305987 RepID=UPI0013A6D7CC|nr:AtpZ/AtpI family protein [Lentilitoribacter sp. Alg239-R112]